GRAVHRSLAADRKLEAFFLCWTRKEAYLKATGEGLSFPPERVGVSQGPGDPPSLLHVEGRPGEPGRWRLRDVTVSPGYVSAVAVQGEGGGRRCCGHAI